MPQTHALDLPVARERSTAHAFGILMAPAESMISSLRSPHQSHADDMVLICQGSSRIRGCVDVGRDAAASAGCARGHKAVWEEPLVPVHSWGLLQEQQQAEQHA